MSKILLTTDTDLTAVADAIRAKNGTVKALVYPEDYIIGIRSISAASASGNSSISVSDAEDGDICSLTQYGVCEQDAQTNAISCNNGVLSISNGEVVATAANSETLTLGSQTATVENLYSVGSVRDEQEITTGRIVRRNNVCIYDGTQNVGDRYLSSTGAKDNGAIVVYPMETEYNGQSNVTFTEDETKDINLLEASISPIQSLNGYSNPWPGGGGANKFGVTDVTDLANGTSRKLSISDGLMTVTATGGISSTVIVGQSALANVIINATLLAGTYYFKIFDFSSTVTGATADRIKLRIETNGTNTDYARDTAFTLSADSTIVGFYVASALQWNSDNTMKLRVAISATNVDAWTPYSNICPITGRTGLNVYDDPKYGGMIVWNQIFRAGVSNSLNGLTFSHDNAWATQTITGTSTATVYKQLDMAKTIVGHVYFVDKGTDNTNMQIYNDSAGVTTTTSSQHGLGKATASKNFYLWFRNGSTFNLTIKPMICDLTVMFGSAKADEIYAMEQAEAGSGVAYFKTLFANEYYPYNAGETTNVSDVDGTTYWKETVDWTSAAGTVYGGTLDVVTGVLTVTHKILDLGTKSWLKSGPLFYSEDSAFDGAHDPNGKYLLCSQYKGGDAYGGNANNTIDIRVGTYKRIWIRDDSKSGYTSAQFKAAMDGVQLVYLLATPLTYQLTPQEVVTLVGQNNIFSPDATSIKVAVSNPVIERVAPHPFTLNSGSNTISANNLSVSSVPLKIAYGANLPIYDGGVI